MNDEANRDSGDRLLLSVPHSVSASIRGPSSHANSGFSLAEVTIAIGIFAFAVVGILGLFPTATKMRSNSAFDTRAVMIAQQLFSYVESAGGISDTSPNSSGIMFSVSDVALRDGPALLPTNTRTEINLTNSGGVVLGYLNRSSMPYYFFGTNNPSAWTNMPSIVEGSVATTSENEITILARLSAAVEPSDCHQYRVTVEVRSPAAASLTNSAGQTNTALNIVTFTRFF